MADNTDNRPLAHESTPPNSAHREGLDRESHAELKRDPSNEDAKLDIAIDETFPASDPPSTTQPGRSNLEPAPSSGFKGDDAAEPPPLDGE